MSKKKSNNNNSKDLRSMRPIMVRENASSQTLTLQQSELIDINGCELAFPTPNNVSIFVSIAKKELQVSKKIYQTIVVEKIKKKKEVELENRDASKLYNYLEHIQTSIICIYTAIEALANVAIPNDYEYKTKNSKGISESWDKEAIERWFKTSDKYTKIIPGILEVSSPNTQNFWSKFKELEVIRNDIIHQKTSMKKPTDVDSKYLNTLLQSRIFDIVDSGFELIMYVCNSDQSHAFFPLGFGPAQIKVKEMDKFSDNLELVKKSKT